MSETPETAPQAETQAETQPDFDSGSTSDVPRESTGVPRIDAALDRLDGLEALDINHHPDEFDTIHRVLRESLAGAGRDEDTPDIA